MVIAERFLVSRLKIYANSYFPLFNLPFLAPLLFTNQGQKLSKERQRSVFLKLLAPLLLTNQGQKLSKESRNKLHFLFPTLA
jgi:hypothetical protein